MSISQKFTAAAILVAGLGVGAGVDAAPTHFETEKRASKATTCEGDDQCGGLGKICDFFGGTFNSHHSRDHGHEHGICTWPWE